MGPEKETKKDLAQGPDVTLEGASFGPLRAELGYKRIVESLVLDRIAHADVFEIGGAPKFAFLLCGGSGMEQDRYEERAKTVIPVFKETLQGLAGSSIDALLVYISAPYDLPLNRFSNDRASAEKWNVHVLGEIMEPWRGLPYFVSGFSGGATLAFNGLERHPLCFGGAAFGGDGLTMDFTRPPHWKGKLLMYSTPGDRVASAPDNRAIAHTLERFNQAERHVLPRGGHRLEDYASMDCLGEAIRIADRVISKTSVDKPLRG